MLFKTVLLFAVLAIINADVVPVKDCGSQTGTIVSVDVEGCTAPPCKLKKGEDAQMKLKFQSNVQTSVVTSKVYGVIAGISIPFSLPQADSCLLGASCPVAPADVNELTIRLPILSLYPSLSLDVKWEIIDQNKKKIVCFRLPVKISS